MTLSSYDARNENQLIKDNIGLVISIAKSFNPPDQHSLDEYIQIGRIGLLTALRKYNPTKGKLTTIAWPSIKNAILRHIRKEACYHQSTVSLEKIGDFPAQYRYKIWEIIPSNLSVMENQILRMKFEQYTFQEIANKFGGKTKGWANGAYKKILTKLRKANTTR